jgi:beta-glucanase (GH16 family)
VKQIKNIRKLAALCFILSGQGAFAATGELLWSDEFNHGSVPDPAVWSHDLGNWGWGNSELQNYTDRPENARIEDGKLVISVIGEPSGGSSFSSARIRTQDKLTFKYGTVEARIKMPDLADGLWPAFWTLGNNFSDVGWPACGELDIMEMGHSAAISAGTVNRRVGSTAHWENNGSHAQYGQSLLMPEDLDDGYHLFRMEWTPESVRTYVDGNPVWVMDISSPSCSDCTEFHEPHFVILNVAVGGNYPWIHSPSGITAPLPADMQVDYVRIYDNDHTELGGSSIENEEPVIDAGHAGAWFNLPTSGQGQLIDIDPVSRYMFMAWFTFTESVDDLPGEQQWYTAQGRYRGDTAVLDLYETLGGRFDEPAEVETVRVGEVTLTFDDCLKGVMFYRFDADGREGGIPIIRVIPGSEHVCEDLRQPAIEAVDVNPGMDGGWFELATSGQGLLFDAHDTPEADPFLFAAWFTFGDETESGQRWLTAQGSANGAVAEIDVYETTGGVFDDPRGVETLKAGTMRLEFADCESATMEYTLDDGPVSGQADLIRLLPAAKAMCENLSGSD